MSRPNLLLFMPDQLRADALGCFGGAATSTPHIDALAARGTRFEQAFSQHSVCTQSRISMFTGWYPHTSGHRSLTHLLRPDEPNVFRLLKQAGYHVALVGARGDMFGEGVTKLSASRWGFTTPPDLGAVHDWHRQRFEPDNPLVDTFLGGVMASADDGSEPFDLDEATVRTAIDWFVEGLPEPWCVFVPLIFPHPPFAVGEPWYSMHDRSAMPLPIPAVADKPGFHREIRSRYGLDAVGDEDWREIRAVYAGMVSRVDDQLRRVLSAVDQAGQREDTITFFFTDHGEYLGDFGLVEKWPSGLDPSLVHNPLIIDDPTSSAGVCSSGVEMVDLAATLLDYADVDAEYTHFGKSLRHLTRDPAAPHRAACFSEGGFLRSEGRLLEPAAGGRYRHKGAIQHELPELVGLAACVRTPEWTFIERLYESDELYHRVGDPLETTNLIGDSKLVEVVHEHRALLSAWHLETSSVFPWEPDERMETVLRHELRPR